MFTIYGGKTEFNQWDQGQRVTNPNMVVGDKVRFWNATGETHPMIAYLHEGVVVADVPNDLLQNACPIVVELCGKPECQGRFTVNFVSDKKPDGYIFIDNTHCEPVTPSAGGVSSWNDLTDKPFYKESNKTVIEWDGNTAGHEEATISIENGFTMWCISGSVPTVEELQSAELEILYGGEVMSGKASDLGQCLEIGSVYFVAGGMAMIAKEPVVFEHENGFTITFPKAGVYSMLSEGTYVKKLTYGTETIKTIDPEFLPAKGTFVVNLFHSYENGTWTSDKTAEEIVKAVRRGEAVQCVETNDDGINGAIWQLQSVNDYIDISSMMPEYTPHYVATFNRFEVFEGNCRCQYLSINHDGTIYASNQKTFDIFDDN